MQKSYVINGKFVAERMQGIVRYAWEIVKAMDSLLNGDFTVTLLVPPNAKDIPRFQCINVTSYGTHTGICWEQTDLRKYLKDHPDSMCLNLCNVAPLFVQPGVTIVHDIMYKVNPKDYKTFRNKLSRYWHIFQYWYITMHEKAIITVSNFCKEEIEKYYLNSKGKVYVIPSAWQHVLDYKESTDWQERYPFLKPKEYFFSLSTLSRNKNGKWIIENAKHNTDYVYAIAGKYYETDKFQIPKNIHMLGFISDEDACALIRNCRAFIHPSLYEGFGLPPLEALALGADVICSNATAMPEVLDNSVHYINPLNWKVDLDTMLDQSVVPRENVLEKFSWKESAAEILSIMINI